MAPDRLQRYHTGQFLVDVDEDCGTDDGGDNVAILEILYLRVDVNYKLIYDSMIKCNEAATKNMQKRRKISG